MDAKRKPSPHPQECCISKSPGKPLSPRPWGMAVTWLTDALRMDERAKCKLQITYNVFLTSRKWADHRRLLDSYHRMGPICSNMEAHRLLE